MVPAHLSWAFAFPFSILFRRSGSGSGFSMQTVTAIGTTVELIRAQVPSVTARICRRWVGGALRAETELRSSEEVKRNGISTSMEMRFWTIAKLTSAQV